MLKLRLARTVVGMLPIRALLAALLRRPQTIRDGFKEFHRQLRAHRHAPMMSTGKRTTFDRVFFGHQHGQIVAKIQIHRGEWMVIIERMLNRVDSGGTQLRKETPRIADTGDGMNALAVEIAQWTYLLRTERHRHVATQ